MKKGKEKKTMDEINKYLKFLSLKFSQTIVQSRLGSIIHTNCHNTGSGDWVSRKIKVLISFTNKGHFEKKNKNHHNNTNGNCL